MTFQVIDNPELQKNPKHSGFSNAEFRKLAGLFSRAASVKALFDIAVDVDFDDNTCAFTYFRSNARTPYLQLVIRRVGPQANLYELYKEGKGRIQRSSLFDRVFESLEEEVSSLMESANS